MQSTTERINARERRYYDANFDVASWEQVETELKKLLKLPVNSARDLITLLEMRSELGAMIGQEMAWRYIRMTCDTENSQLEKAYNQFYTEIIARSKPYDFQLDQRFHDSEWRRELDQDQYGHLTRIVNNQIELYREENIPLETKEKELAAQYGSMYGKLTARYKGEEKTLKQLQVYQKDPDRAVREETWRLRNGRMLQERESFNELFDKMRTIREQKAKNAGFHHYRDFRHHELARFDYTPQDLEVFHQSVEEHVVPAIARQLERRKSILKLDALRPWDLSVDLDGKKLTPFTSADELIDKSARILHNVRPIFGNQLQRMRNTGLLDLENRAGKAPGGYNYPLEELGSSFIFMNAVGLHDDLVTMLHESGHAMHAMYTRDIPIAEYRHTPSELAELASMAMELITMDHWQIAYPEDADLKKARREQLEGVLEFMPWFMIIDAFQHWVYTHPDHTPAERDEFFGTLRDRYNAGVDWTGLDMEKSALWIMQLHVFEIPFYYIEYAISQLGSIAVYRNYRTDPQKAINQYIDCLKLGYTRHLPEAFEAAGIRFDFSPDYIRELVHFIQEELKSLE